MNRRMMTNGTKFGAQYELRPGVWEGYLTVFDSREACQGFIDRMAERDMVNWVPVETLDSVEVVDEAKR